MVSFPTGRCYYGRQSARKIVYPDHSIDYFSNDITHGGLDDTDSALDADFLYFDSERDVELATELWRMAKLEEVRHKLSTRKRMMSEWNIGPIC